MLGAGRLRNRIVAKLMARSPFLAKRLIGAYMPGESADIPWAPFRKPLEESTVALVTTAGVHRRDQIPFDMLDPDGDPTFREIGKDTPMKDLRITHDYYDHSDADKDINLVFPLERLRELRSEGAVGGVAPVHFGFMGHILGAHVRELVTVHAPRVAGRLLEDRVDCVLLVPG
jgi:D-proline reductase (dithiol) PrdB